jgi:hypothetical protein
MDGHVFHGLSRISPNLQLGTLCPGSPVSPGWQRIGIFCRFLFFFRLFLPFSAFFEIFEIFSDRFFFPGRRSFRRLPLHHAASVCVYHFFPGACGAKIIRIGARVAEISNFPGACGAKQERPRPQ